MAYGVIYKIVNQLDGKPYVWQTTRTIEERFKEHARCKKSHLGKAIRAHGVENFSCEIIEECDTREQLNEREIFWIATLNCKTPNGYNISDGGEGVVGIERTPETRAKISAAQSGEKAYWFGKHHTEKTRAKMSATHKGKPNSPEHNAKISVAKTGKLRSEETASKISIGRRGESSYKNLLAEMDKRQITYRGLAKLLDLTQSIISRKMHGRRNFTAEQIAKLVEIFDKPAEYIMARE